MLIKEPSTTNKIAERLQDTLRSPKKSFFLGLSSAILGLLLMQLASSDSIPVLGIILAWVAIIACFGGALTVAWAGLLSIYLIGAQLLTGKRLEEPYATWFFGLEAIALLVLGISIWVHGGMNVTAAVALSFAGLCIVIMLFTTIFLSESRVTKEYRETLPNVDEYLEEHRAPGGGVSCWRRGGRHLGGRHPEKRRSFRVHYCQTCATDLYYTE